MELTDIPDGTPILIAGPTASGKSGLALRIAEARGGVIVNADALQVYASWRVLTARPSDGDLARAPHALYGHVGPDADYSVGHWLREIEGVLTGRERPIFVGGTGLYLSALTGGLAEIPATPLEVRALADARIADGGIAGMIAELDAATRARIDLQNPVRVQRAWEVQTATGRGLAAWQDEPVRPLIAGDTAVRLVVDAPPAWLNPRIERRFDAMLDGGALDEVRRNLPGWDPRRPSSRAIGAAELVAHLAGELSLDVARELALIATRQYAKRQRTWFRARMRDWTLVQTED